MSESSDAIVDLQSRVLFQEDVIQKLDEVIIRQGTQLDNLSRRVDELQERLEQLQRDQNGPAAPQDETPPHY